MFPCCKRIFTVLAALAGVCLAGRIPPASAQVTGCYPSVPTQPARAPAHLLSGVGRAHLPVTTRSADAQTYFDQGLALLDSGWPFEADHAFSQAARLDPQCAMAQWGIAMAALNEARRDSAIARAQALSAPAGARERLYIDALSARTRMAGGVGPTRAPERPGAPGVAPGGVQDPSEAYRRALRKLAGAYSDDMEAKLLLAQALFAGYEDDGTPRPGTTEAIALWELALHKDPKNPGAFHALAHAYEIGPSPEKGVQAAEQFAKATPALAHALHLKGRLRLKLSQPEDAIRAFEAAASMDEAWMRRERESSGHASGPYSGNLFLLAMVYADQGRYRDAMRAASRLLDQARQPGEAQSAVALDGRLATLRLLVRFGRWNEILDGKSLPDDGGFEVLKPWRHYALGRALIGRGEMDRAWAELIALDKDVTRLKRGLPKTAPLRPLQDRQMLALPAAPFELKGRILAREGMGDEALAILRQGLDVEKKSAAVDPRLYPLPMEEAMGDVGLDLRRWSDAESAYRAALEHEPGNARALLGLARSLEAAGKTAEAAEARARFARAWARADADQLQGASAPLPSGTKPDPRTATGSGAGKPPAVAPAQAPAQARTQAPVQTQAPAQARAQAPAQAPAADPYASKLKRVGVNGVRLAYVVVGKGEPIVMVHGALADYRTWAPQIEALSKHYRVVAYSRRYCYPNLPPDEKSDGSYAANEQDLVALIRLLRLGKVNLLGHGYGALVATLVARDHPEMIRTLMLAEPGVYSMLPRKSRRTVVDGLKAATASSGDAVRSGDFERAARLFYASVGASAGAFDSLPEPQRRMMQDNARTLLLGAESPPSFSCEDAQRIRMRTLLIEGDGTPRNEQQALEGLERCLPTRDRARIEGASRVVNRGNPAAFNDAIVRFLEAPTTTAEPTDDEP